jgi:hypothetical protein
MYDLRFLRRWLWRMTSSGIYNPSSYLTGDTLRLRYRAEPANIMQDLRFSRQWLWRMPPSGIQNPSFYLTGKTLYLAIDTSRLILCKIWVFHGGDCEECRNSFRLLVTANVVTSSPIVILMMEVPRSSGTSVLTRATRRHIPEYGILPSPFHSKPFSKTN